MCASVFETNTRQEKTNRHQPELRVYLKYDVVQYNSYKRKANKLLKFTMSCNVFLGGVDEVISTDSVDQHSKKIDAKWLSGDTTPLTFTMLRVTSTLALVLKFRHY